MHAARASWALSEVERAAEQAAQARDQQLARGRRRREGIVHTPPLLARFVARAVDALLREELGVLQGVADDAVAIVDPACGPGAFLAAVLTVGSGRGSVPRMMRGIDRDQEAVAAARALIGGAASKQGWPCDFEVDDPLCNMKPGRLARLAPWLVILGNPPWIGSAQDRPVKWLDDLLEDFRRDGDGQPLFERKLGVLSDAYVRFMRWTSEAVRHAQAGAVLALVTNGSYLDGPVHRGMRAALRRTFSAIHVIDLGGNALLARSVGRDDNVFGVRPSAAVLLGVRHKEHDERTLANVRYSRITGSREQKLAQLQTLDLSDASWRRLTVSGPFQRFVPTAVPCDDYATWPSLAELMPFHREGVQTNRDEMVIDSDRERLLARLTAFAAGEVRPELDLALRPLAHYSPQLAQRAVLEALSRDPDGSLGLLVRRLDYRPFDARYFAPITPLCHRPRKELLRAMDRSELALITVRKDRGSKPWVHFAAAQIAIDNCFLSTRSSCRARAFPSHDPGGKPNLGPGTELFSERIGRAITSPELLHYALAVLASPSYRTRNDEALRIDYPRIPLPQDAKTFDARCRAGSELGRLLCEPIERGAAQSDATYAEVALDEDTGDLRLGEECLAILPRAALALSLGHHRPVHELLRSHAPLDRTHLAGLCSRLGILANAITRLDA